MNQKALELTHHITSLPEKNARAALEKIYHQGLVADHPIGAPSLRPGPQPRKAGAFFGITENNEKIRANPRGAALVLGPPGSGKTQSVIIPSVVCAPGACVSSSTKTEVMFATYQQRQRLGRTWFFNPGGDGAQKPEGVYDLRWNPLIGITNWDDSLSVAARLTQPFITDKEQHWIDRARVWIAVNLCTAKIAGASVDCLAEWCLNGVSRLSDVQEILTKFNRYGFDGLGIVQAAAESFANMSPNEKSGVASTMARIMHVYAFTAAREVGSRTNFDPARFVRSRDTIYIACSGARQNDYAPLIAALLEEIRIQQYALYNAAGAGHMVPLTFVLDEVANTAPIPIPQIASEAGGQGLHLVCAFQDFNQATIRWGETAAGTLMTMFGDKLIMPGLNHAHVLNTLSELAGTINIPSVSTSASFDPRGNFTGSTYNRSWNMGSRLSPADITNLGPGKALYFSGQGNISYLKIRQRPWYDTAFWGALR